VVHLEAIGVGRGKGVVYLPAKPHGPAYPARTPQAPGPCPAGPGPRAVLVAVATHGHRLSPIR
jgi:hypothetical protein